MPNTISELNDWSDEPVEFQDQRPYSISFSANAAANTSTTIDEDQYFVVPTGINITNVLSQPGNITYNINLSNVANAILTWPTLPTGVTSSSNAGVYSITGVFNANTWLQARQANVIVPDRETNFDFTANLQYPSTANTSVTNTWSWTNNVTIANINPDVFFTQAYTFAEDSQTQIVYTIDDPDPTIVNFTVRVAPRAGTTGTILLNGNNQGVGNAATITGNIATVQAANITYVPYPDDTSTVNLRADAYKTNGVGNVSVESNLSLTLTCTSTHDDYQLGNIFNVASYTPNIVTVTDTDANATSYTISLSSSQATFFYNGSNSGNTLTVTDTKANVNSANIGFTSNSYSNIAIQYSQSKVNTVFGNVIQASNVTAQFQPTVSGLDQVRTYLTYQGTKIFTSTVPTLNIGNATRTLTVSTSDGYIGFGNNTVGLSNSYSTTFNNSTFSSVLSNVTFYPFGNATTSSNVVLNISEGSNVLCNAPIALTANVVPVPDYSGIEYITTTQSYTPSLQRSLYQRADVTLVGGGGPGIFIKSTGGGGYEFIHGSGGGGGQVSTQANISVPYSSSSISIGAGGQSGNATTPGTAPYVLNRSDGGNTSAFGYTAQGGRRSPSGAEYPLYYPAPVPGIPTFFNFQPGGNSGANINSGGNSLGFTPSGGGFASVSAGGGGAGGAGSNATRSGNTGIPGTAGTGVTLYGNTYGIGGSGQWNNSVTGYGGGGPGLGWTDSNYSGGFSPSTPFPPSDVFLNGNPGIVIINWHV